MDSDNIKSIREINKDYFLYSYGLSFENNESAYTDLYNIYMISLRKRKIKNILDV